VAVLAADVAGYSRLMGEDEEGTLAQLKGSPYEHSGVATEFGPGAL
jgi:class 3 adenylate cyclase